ncbi:pentatricopeptide repeat-containing protein At5g48730, chloroplastic [Lactuca sativa]|uniref:Pentacotripeptide-repeat region of PRORP domain-containing protein n=1 Tax=Lactuca sativa TaxID=4236 RepID=A0A9R1WZA8_LACSA|nr:pentatricopeptide repeat-containing protein At5g48730, chloroplastic [Lactuca sativa]XP_023759229.1 pentatricopeptide repeat-containing protein At5g48730, chloroplastic [Lactuca sativa]XP_042752832.1 pentatricopeptide repeat-containing protein At5g48730, chloroplastic [Lactuca sativa]XP_042752835.1 pentatricopeptide repeat-containing protein At5g48730, chloroplastic [Lactuca sativa]XP_042752837.1 pentatricopeptide repeat-containing protein At5g48730, chloroplastic [Lactuca sativa]KAJ0192279
MVSLPGPAVNPFRPDFNGFSENKKPTGATNVNPVREESFPTDDEKVRRERKEQVNKKIASQKAISVILRREATKAVIEKKKGSTRLFPGTVLEALHERIAALRWESALKVFELLREQLWYRPNSAIYVKLIVMLGKCKQPERANSLFQAMIDEGCDVNQESYTALLSAYSRSGLFRKAFSILEEMKNTPNCHPDVYTYSILIKSCLHFHEFDKVQSLLSEMVSQGVNPNTVTYNTLIDAYGKAKRFADMESTLVEMLRQRECKPDVWTMNSTLRAFGGSGQIETMEKCYDKFLSAGIQPNIKTFNILLDSYGKTGNYKKMSAVMEYMQKYHFSWTLVTYNIVIDAFGRAGDVNQMEFLFRLMQSESIKPNCVTLCSLVRGYAQNGKAEKIGGLLRYIESSDVMVDTVFFNCLVDAYGMMGCLAEMKGVLVMMESKGCEPDKITYRTMIKAYNMNGMSNHVKELRLMLSSVGKSDSRR